VSHVVHIARCPEHGLHGARKTCFICEGDVDQVPMVAQAEYQVVRDALASVLDAVDGMPGVHNPNSAVGYTCALARELIT
jgi:hypothetical protein